MRTLEILHLRLAGEHPEGLVDLIRQAGANGPESMELRVFRHARLNTDLLIQIRRTEDSDEGGGLSPSGIALASVLREYGMVEHSVWEKAEEG